MFIIYLFYLVIILAILASVIAIHPGIATITYLVGIYILQSNISQFIRDTNAGKSTGGNFVAGAPAFPAMPEFIAILLSFILTVAAGFLVFLNWKNSKLHKTLEFQQYWIKMFTLNIIGLGTLVLLAVGVLIVSFIGTIVSQLF